MPSRVFNDARREQGFVSQEHLDAFYRSYDHAKSCAVCSSVGGFVPLDDGMQPYMNQCDEGRALEAESFRYHRAVRPSRNAISPDSVA